MSAIDTIERIIDTNLAIADLRFCLVDAEKHPFTLRGNMARVNHNEDFSAIEDFANCKVLGEFAGLGISVQASNICGVDIDACVETPNDPSTISKYALSIIEIFKSWAYIEFSFSGTGIRILFRQKNIEDYKKKYYVKNSAKHTEYYQPGTKEEVSPRYLTVTGRAIYDNPIDSGEDHMKDVLKFLDADMKRKYVAEYEVATKHEEHDDRTVEQLVNIAKLCMISDGDFCDLWFHKAPGSGSDESERDFFLLKKIYTKVTKDKEKLREVFEQSDFFKSKDRKHVAKWNNSNHRYFNYIFERL